MRRPRQGENLEAAVSREDVLSLTLNPSNVFLEREKKSLVRLLLPDPHVDECALQQRTLQ